MLSSDNKDTFLSIVRLGIGHDGGQSPKCDDWNAIEALATEQGLSAVMVDGIEMLPEDKRPKGNFSRLLYKYQRWKGNAWKHDLCYRDNIVLSFFTGLWAHLIKPSSL